MEIKYNLMMSYCSYLTYFMLLKVEGAEVKGHPCVDRLVQIKLLLEKLKPLDLKLQYQIQKMASQGSGQQTALKYKPNLDQLVHNQAKQEKLKEMSDSEESAKAKGVYKAPKTNAVAFREDERKNKNIK